MERLYELHTYYYDEHHTFEFTAHLERAIDHTKECPPELYG